ncbi:MAG TPA: LysR family transcriptional regulator [Candidatus Binatia bacterium]|jgi:DNA-binding transcriptional LysR family regulator|nr:LysR family transcriptional regulator [Candidatus Binatia bacterium]
MDRFKTMDSFVRVASTGSFSAAAKQLGISRALVSLHITDLEKRLGVRLLNRTTRCLTLTEAGASYLEFCQRMLAEMNQQESSIAQMQKEPRGSLKVTAPKSFGTLYLSDAVVGFSAQYPHIQTSLILEDYSFRAYDFVDNGLDVAVRLGDLPDSSLIARKIATLQWIICASPKYLARHGEPKTPADLGKHPCLAHVNLDPNDRAWRLHDSDNLISVKISGTFSSNSALVLRKAALAGLGIGYLPLYCIEDDLKTGALHKLLPNYSPPQRPIYVVYPPTARVPERVRTFVDFLAHWFGNSRAAKSGSKAQKRDFGRVRRQSTLRPVSTY